MSNPRLQVDIGANTREFTTALNTVQAKMNQVASGVQKVGRTMSVALTAPLVAFAAKSVQAYDVQAQAEQQLLVALGNRADVQQRLIKQAQELQGQTLFGDEETIRAQALIAAFVDEEEAIKKVIPLVQDMAQAKKMDLAGAADLVSKTLGSSTNALSRYGIEVTGAVGSTERLETLTRGLEKHFGGAAEAASKAGAGGIKQMQMAFGDLQEAIGKVVVKGILPLAKKLKKAFENFQKLPDETIEKIVKLGAGLAAIGPILITLGIAFKTLALIIGALTSPITLVIVAIMGIASAGLYVYKNWEALKERMGDPAWWKNLMVSMMQIFLKYNAFSLLFDGFVKIAELITQHMGGMLNTIIKGFLKFQAKIKDVVGDMAETIGGLARHLPGMDVMGASIQAFGVLEKEGSKSLEELANSGTDFAGIINEKLQNIENPFHKLAEGLEDAKAKQQEYNTELQTAVEFLKSLGDDVLKLMGISFLPKTETTETPQEETTAQEAVNTALEEKKTILQKTLEIFPNLIEAMQTYVLQFADGLASIIVYGGKIKEMLADIAKQMASKALSKFIEIFLLGGATGGLGTIFGGFFGKEGGLLGGILPKIFGASGAISAGAMTPQLSGANITVGGQFVLKGTDLVGSITKTQNSVLR